MSGGKDFCKWSKQAILMRGILKHTLNFVFGKYGIGLADIGVAEAFYEQGEVSKSLIELTKTS